MSAPRSSLGAAPAWSRTCATAAFKGEIFAVNPRYSDVLGYRCFPSVVELPDSVDCIVIAIPAKAACDVMEQAFARGIRAAIVLAAGFDEASLAARLKALAQQGMAICGAELASGW